MKLGNVLIAFVATVTVACSSGSAPPPDLTESTSQANIINPHCAPVYAPVCALPPGIFPPQYGVTYFNECTAKKADAFVVAQGACPGQNQVCGENGVSGWCVAGFSCGCPAGANCQLDAGGSQPTICLPWVDQPSP
jgi:hypothetical protein